MVHMWTIIVLGYIFHSNGLNDDINLILNLNFENNLFNLKFSRFIVRLLINLQLNYFQKQK